MTQFNLPQEFTLLALTEKGNIRASVAGYQEMYFLAAILIELAILGKLDIQEDILSVKDNTPTQITYLDQVLEQIYTAKKPKSVKDWAYDLYMYNKLPACKNILESLIDKDILTKEEGKFLLVFSYTNFLPKNPQTKDEIVQQIREAILGEQEIPFKTTGLILLLEKTYILEDLFSKYEQAKFKSKLQEIKDNQNVATSINQALSKIIEEVSSAADSVILTVS